jgi:hypothetical protein
MNVSFSLKEQMSGFFILNTEADSDKYVVSLGICCLASGFIEFMVLTFWIVFI